MIDMDDDLIKKARANRRLFLGTLAAILFVGVVVLADIVRQL